MERKKLLMGIILVSAVIAAGLAVIQSQSAYAPRKYEEVFWETDSVLPEEMYAEEVMEEAEASGFLFFEAPPPEAAPGAAPAASEQKLIKTSSMSLDVEDFHKAADAVGAIAKKYNGYLADSSVRDYEGRKIGYVTVRVPGENFEDAIKEIETVGNLKEENISVEDVTEQYIDLTARLRSSKRQEERYLEILDMATTVEDVLEVEDQLERIRSEIESLQGRLNYLDNRIDFSTVRVRLSEPEIITHESGIGRAFSEAVDGFLAVIRGIIIFLGYFIPIAIFLTILGFAGWYIYRKVSKER